MTSSSDAQLLPSVSAASWLTSFQVPCLVAAWFCGPFLFVFLVTATVCGWVLCESGDAVFWSVLRRVAKTVWCQWQIFPPPDIYRVALGLRNLLRGDFFLSFLLLFVGICGKSPWTNNSQSWSTLFFFNQVFERAPRTLEWISWTSRSCWTFLRFQILSGAIYFLLQSDRLRWCVLH